MNGFCEDVRTLIGDDLQEIGARHIRDSQIGDDEVCFFSVDSKTVAICYSLMGGASCFIQDTESANLLEYETWNSLWHLLDMDKNRGNNEALMAYLDLFPTEYDEFIKFIGERIVEYFKHHIKRG